MLGQHLHHFPRSDRGIDVFAQAGKELVKSILVRTRNRNQTIDALDIALRDLGDIRCPLLPIAFVPHLLHHAGIDGIFQLFQLRYGQGKVGWRPFPIPFVSDIAFILIRL